jgi:hypothetical protein
MRLCATIPIPDFNTLYNAALPAFKIPFTVPTLPSLPNPIYGNLKIPNVELLQIIQELQSYQFMTTFMSFLTPLTSFLGLSLDAILPKIPGTDLTLLDLMALIPNKISTAIQQALAHFGPGIFPALPVPLYYAVNIPSIQVTTAVKMAIKGYMNTLILLVESLINKVIGKLHLPGLPTIPVVPTMDVIMGMILGSIPTFPTSITALLNKYSLNALLARVVIPGFPAFPALPEPLIPKLNMPEINLMEGINILYTNLLALPMTIMMDFCMRVLTMIGFSFPTICITI